MNQPHYKQYPPHQYPPPYQYPPVQQATPSDLEHLRLLSIGYYVAAAFSALFGFLPLVHVGMGVAMVTGSMPGSRGSGPPAEMGWLFVAIGVTFMFALFSLAVVNFLTARFIAKREKRTFCIVIAALNCLHAPLGTLLGVFTIVVLSRDAVRTLFER
jgi:hypothetical protein